MSAGKNLMPISPYLWSITRICLELPLCVATGKGETKLIDTTKNGRAKLASTGKVHNQDQDDRKQKEIACCSSHFIHVALPPPFLPRRSVCKKMQAMHQGQSVPCRADNPQDDQGLTEEVDQRSSFRCLLSLSRSAFLLSHWVWERVCVYPFNCNASILIMPLNSSACVTNNSKRASQRSQYTITRPQLVWATRAIRAIIMIQVVSHESAPIIIESPPKPLS